MASRGQAKDERGSYRSHIAPDFWTEGADVNASRSFGTMHALTAHGASWAARLELRRGKPARMSRSAPIDVAGCGTRHGRCAVWCPMPDYDDEMTDRAVRAYLSDPDRDSKGEPQRPDRNMTRRDGDRITIANESGTLATYRIIGEGNAACVRCVPSLKGPASHASRRVPARNAVGHSRG